MKRIALPAVATALLGAASATQAQPALELKEASYELTLENVTLPSSTVGTVIFRECPECATHSMPVNPATRYFVDGVELSFDKFRAAADTLRSSLGPDLAVGVYVHYALDTSAVNRIRLSKFEFSR